MTWGEAIGLSAVIAFMALLWFIWRNFHRMKVQDTKIYEAELARQRALEQPITLSLLRSYGFKIHDTKDKIYALNGSISMTHVEAGHWETEIQAPGTILWRDIHYTIGQLLDFCAKHGFELTKLDSDE